MITLLAPDCFTYPASSFFTWTSETSLPYALQGGPVPAGDVAVLR
ncbi:hypothetical protein [Corallococcus sp. AB011P]|nr:hypothetical protein [Corallococcus sp. AB011P]